MLATENCFEHMKRRNISPESAMFPMSGQTAHILGSTLIKKSKSHPPGAQPGLRRNFKAVLALLAHEHPGLVPGDGPIFNSFFNQLAHQLAPFGAIFYF